MSLHIIGMLLLVPTPSFAQDGRNTGAATSLSAAEDCFRGGLEVARQQDALSWELRGVMSLARLRVRQDRPDEARQGLAPVYDRFTEGFETTRSSIRNGNARSATARLRLTWPARLRSLSKATSHPRMSSQNHALARSRLRRPHVRAECLLAPRFLFGE